jgi:hypothetical protein
MKLMEILVRYKYDPAIAQVIKSSVSKHGGPGSSPGHAIWALWWTKWYGGRFSRSTSVSPANSHSTDRSTLIIYHPGLVQ